MRTISIINLKGGVAKTTSSVNLAYALNQMGFQVLLIDNDKQGDCSRWMNRRSENARGIDKIMMGIREMDSLIQKTDYEGLDIITANMNLLQANMHAATEQARPNGLYIRNALRQVKRRYDFCVIDNAPDINISTINAMAAADDILIPIEIDGNSLEGLEILLQTISDIKDGWNPDLEHTRWFITKYNASREIHRSGLEYLRNNGNYLMKTVIRYSEPVSASTVIHQPTALYSARCNATEDYAALAEEYLQMIEED